MITDNDDTQRYMVKAQPIGPTYSAQIVYKSRIMATLTGRDSDELKDRAYRYADCMNWRRAVVEVTKGGDA
ncbi:MAG: hypothetical protein GX771_12005 [Halomonadaceae bacterium]|nr:hypothetical protein [Halomonadaceae bacterium]